MDTTHEFKYPMGAKARDIITGFEGIIVHRVQFLTGCDQYGLLPTGLDKDGDTKKTGQFDENRLELVGTKIVKLADGKTPAKKIKAGGPQAYVGK